MNRPFPEPEQLASLFEGMESYSFASLTSGATAQLVNGDLYLMFAYDDAAIQELKAIRGAHWLPNMKAWQIHAFSGNVHELVAFLKSRGFTFGPDVTAHLRAAWEGY